MKRYRITLKGDTFDVKVLGDPRLDQVQVEVNAETYVVGVEEVPEVPTGELAKTISPSSTTPISASEEPGLDGFSQTVSTPLPGVIKSIAVRSGQQVPPGEELIVIETMKMNNVIRAPREGTIGSIYVAEGRQVAYVEIMLDFVN